MITLHHKYKPLFDDKTRYYVVTGGRGSSKSYSVNTAICALTQESDNKVLFTRKTMTSAHISIIPEFKEKIEKLNWNDCFSVTKTEIINTLSGSEILFRGLQSASGDNTANLKSLQGVTTWVLDEAEELTDEKVFDRIDLSIRHQTKHNRVILILNPTTKEHWIYKRFFEQAGVQEGFNGVKGNVTYIHTDYRDNAQNLSESFLQQIELIKENNPEKYNHVILGGWLNKAEGVIFTNWKIGNFEDNGKTIFGQDYGFSVDPSTLVEVSIFKAQKKIYLRECFYKTGLTTSEIFELNRNYAKKSLIVGDSAEPRLIEELKLKGLNIIEAVKGPGSVTAGIALMQDYELIVDPSSVNLIKELNNYVWNDKKNSTPIDAYNHCFIGSTMITTINGLVPIKDIKVGDLVLTSKGYRKVLIKFNNGKKQVNKYSMQFDTFSVSLCSTKEHKIKSKKWEKISQLQSGMILYLHNHSITKNIDYIQKKDIFQEDAKECTLQFGNITMENAQKDFIFITKTKTHGITSLKTSSVLNQKNILQNTVKKGLKKTQNGLINFILLVSKRLKNGINPKVADCGIQNMEKKHGRIESIKNIFANNVEDSLSQDMQELSNFAIITAKLKHFEQGESWSEEVYDLMVDDCHEYFANGILVHNCTDAVRYSVSHELMGNKEVFFF